MSIIVHPSQITEAAGGMSRSLADKLGDTISVKDPPYGAKGDGTTDDTAAIQAAIIAALAVSGKPLSIYVPSGVYKTSASLLFYDQSGVAFYGAGAATTQFAPTTALAGLPVLLIRNIRNSHFCGFTINPVPSGAGAIGIQIDRAAAGPNATTSTANKFDQITVGGSGFGISDAVRITASLNGDNDKHEFTRSFRVVGFTGNAFYIGHVSALWERIHANLDWGPVGIYIFAGSADIDAVFGPQITDTEVKIGGGGSGYGGHPTTISGNSEQNATNTVKILSVSDPSVEVRFDHYERQGGATSATNVIDWTGTSGALEIIGSRFNFGQPSNTLNISGAGTSATIMGSRLGFDSVNYTARMLYIANTWIPGTVTETDVGGGSGTFVHVSDYGAGFSTTPIQASSGTRWALGPAAGYLSSTGTTLSLTGEDFSVATSTKSVLSDNYSSAVSGDGVVMKGRIATNQSKTAFKFGNSATLNTTGDLLAAFYAGDPATAPVVKSLDRNGKTIYPTGGAADVAGKAVLVAGTVTASTTAVAAGSIILLTRQVTGGTVGDLRVGTITAGTSFVINSASGTDTSTVSWLIIN